MRRLFSSCGTIVSVRLREAITGRYVLGSISLIVSGCFRICRERDYGSSLLFAFCTRTLVLFLPSLGWMVQFRNSSAHLFAQASRPMSCWFYFLFFFHLCPPRKGGAGALFCSYSEEVECAMWAPRHIKRPECSLPRFSCVARFHIENAIGFC